jgi:catechol 2,3-dioxygenase-like lactoylglutathione lyase family enzyme
MTGIKSVTLDVPDPAAAEAFYAGALGADTHVRVRAAETPTTGFRCFTMSLVRIVISSDAGPFTDPDGFAWEAPVMEKR